MYIGIIVFRLLKHSDELDIKTPTLLGVTTLLLGGARPSVLAPRWLYMIRIGVLCLTNLHEKQMDKFWGAPKLQVHNGGHANGKSKNWGRGARWVDDRTPMHIQPVRYITSDKNMPIEDRRWKITHNYLYVNSN